MENETIQRRDTDVAGAGEGEHVYRTSYTHISGELERSVWKLTFKSGLSYGGGHPPTLHRRRHSDTAGSRGGEGKSRGMVVCGRGLCKVASRTRRGLTNQDQE